MTNISSTDYRKDVLETSVAAVPSRPRTPRSVFTALSYQTDDSNFQRYNGDYKFYEGPLLDQWSCGLGSAASTSGYSTQTMWRSSRFGIKSSLPVSYFPSEESCVYSDWRDQDILGSTAGAVIATQHGTMSIRLQGKMRVDMTIDRAIRVINFRTHVVMSLSASGSSSALLHPNGRVYQYGSRVEILAQDAFRGNNKYAKMWYKGISFTSEQCALVYLVDSAGTRTTTDSFLDMSTDFSLNVFYNESRHGPSYQQEAMSLLQNAQYFVCEKGIQNWIINNVRISQTNDGLLRIARNSNKYQIRCSATNGSATITTPFVHTTASLGQTPHLFVRRGERRMHFDGRTFIVRNAGHSSGFDERNMLKVF